MIDTTNHMFTIVVEHKMKNSNNGQTKHWSTTAADRKQWMKALDNATVEVNEIHLSLGEFITEVLLDRPVASLVGLVIERVLGPKERLWDADSVLRGSAKQLIDSIVEYEVLGDDDAKHVLWSLGTQDKSDRTQGPAVRVHFYQVSP